MRPTNSFHPVLNNSTGRSSEPAALLFLRRIMATLISSWLGGGTSTPSLSTVFGTTSLEAVLMSLSLCSRVEKFLPQPQHPLRIYYQVPILIFAGGRFGLITLGYTLNLLTEFSSVITTSVQCRLSCSLFLRLKRRLSLSSLYSCQQWLA